MGKNMGGSVNVKAKAEAARARKTAAEAERKERESREKEDKYWREAEGDKRRAAKKHQEEAEKHAEAAAKKAEARRLAELEEMELEKLTFKIAQKKAPKVTEFELQRRREQEQLQILKHTVGAKNRQIHILHEEEYERMVLLSNTNRDESIIEAHSVKEALARMNVADNLPAVADRHLERQRLKPSAKVDKFVSIEIAVL